MPALFDVIRPSSLSDWADCQRRALHKATSAHQKRGQRKANAKPDIRAWFGTAVHAVVNGEEPPMIPFGMSFNTDLPNERAALDKAETSGNHILLWLKGQGFEIMAQEVKVQHNHFPIQGTVDLVGKHWGVDTIVDLKTGNYPVKSSWFQLTSYAECMKHPHEPPDNPFIPKKIGILRALMLKPIPELSMAFLPAEHFSMEWLNLLMLAEDVRQGNLYPITNPSSNLCKSHCSDKGCAWHPTNLEEGK